MISRTIVFATVLTLLTAWDVVGNMGRSLAVAQVTQLCRSVGPASNAANATIYEEPGIPRPQLRVPITDPVFGSTVIRITDPSMDFGPDRTGVRHEYSTVAPINADNTLILVMTMNGYQAQIRRIADGALIATPTWTGLGGADPFFQWHKTDPTRIVRPVDNEIRVFHTDTLEDEVLVRFPQYEVIVGDHNTIVDDNWRYFAFYGYATVDDWLNRGPGDVVVWDSHTRTVVGRLSFAIGEAPAGVKLSPLGTYVIANIPDPERPPWGSMYVRWDRNFQNQMVLWPDYNHEDTFLDADGSEWHAFFLTSGPQAEAFASQVDGSESGEVIAAVRLSDGAKRILLRRGLPGQREDGTGVTGHLSGIVSRSRPGWILVSSYTEPNPVRDLWTQEVFLLKTDGSQAVQRLAHDHAGQGEIPDIGKDYFAEPHATSSWDGKVFIFASNWNERVPGTRYDTYLVKPSKACP